MSISLTDRGSISSLTTNERRQFDLLADPSNAPRRIVQPVEFCRLIGGDVRLTLPLIPENSIDCVITSPPYGDQKHYGSEGEIGAGQASHKEFLAELEKVFAGLYRCARKGAAMWAVLDTIKRNGRTLPLPWEAITCAETVGWIFQDIVVWDKGKSLPWAHPGHLRGVCEFILLLSKGPLAHFNLDAVRESEHLSSYWVKYPERYHPAGKAPSDLWHFPIPVQGSWGKSGLRHLCPFPPEMVARMIRLTTLPGDVVLDPFAGTGTVPAVAAALERYGVGIEINDSFLSDFEQRGFRAIQQSMLGIDQLNIRGRDTLTSLIPQLRILKLPRTLFNGLSRVDRMGLDARTMIAAIIIESSTGYEAPSPRAQLRLLLRAGFSAEPIQEYSDRLLSIEPISKFGVNVSANAVLHDEWTDPIYVEQFLTREWYAYENGVFHKFKTRLPGSHVADVIATLSDSVSKRYPLVIADIGLQIQAGLPD